MPHIIDMFGWLYE